MKKHILPVITAMIITMCSCTATIDMHETETEPTITKMQTTAKTTEKANDTETKTETETAQDTTEPETTAALDNIDNILNSMSIGEKVGQMILARCPENTASADMDTYQFGGYTLYARDFDGETVDSVKQNISDIQTNAKIPAFIAVDEEGGNIVRVSKYKQFTDKPFMSPQEIVKNNAMDTDTNAKCDLLYSLGINFNLAPVADITNSKSDYMYDRTFGLSATETGEKIAEMVTIMNGKNIASCLKHFPGYGSNVDTHTGIAVDTRSANDFESNDFIPFEYGINAGTPAVLVNHNIINAYNDKLPASLAPEVHDVLRTKLSFNGVILTDDLGMDAIRLYSGDESVYVLGVLAGNDLLCVTDSVTCYNDVLNAVNDGKITEDRLNESVRRILQMKMDYGIL